ncbi:MAG: hypothetical protein DMF64_16475 [Acidobacteria bacterium]|nr:MAG: hypothetical protein DMF64_16475 [Acidobacteriota bacterium]
MYFFPPFRLDPTERRLLCAGEPLHLPPKLLDLLIVLVRNSGHMLTKDELMAHVWPDTFVDEGSLARSISRLRKILGDTRAGTRYIETVSKQGYRFIAVVKELQEGRPRHGRQPPAAHGRLKVDKAMGRAGLLAVLPFKHIGTAGNEGYLGFGIADALIANLSHLSHVKVRPTGAVRRFDSLGTDAVAAGRELGVDVVLDGSVQRADERVRVTVRLVSVRAQALLWAEKFDGTFNDIFAMQDAISEQVARVLLLQLSGAESEHLTKRYTESAEAYQFYLRGRYCWNKRTEEGLKKGIAHFERAITLDPQYARAYAGLADCYDVLSGMNMLPPHEGYPQAKAAALRALELDDTLAEAHASLAHLLMRYDWDWAGAEREFRRALALNPNYATAHHWYGVYLSAMGRHAEAVASAHRALQLDPLSPIINLVLGTHYYWVRRYEQTLEQQRKVLEIEPDHVVAHAFMGQCYALMGRYDEALAELQKVATLTGQDLSVLPTIGYVHALAGQRAQARAVLARLRANWQGRRYAAAYDVAKIYLALGAHERALRWLRQSFADRDGDLIFLNVDPSFVQLHAHPRFVNLLRRIGFTDLPCAIVAGP